MSASERLSLADERELAWWRVEFATRIEPGSVKWIDGSQCMYGRRLKITPLNPEDD